MNWSLLGIAPTKDKKEITAAYRSQLAHTNPEDKPEEFKALRAAYEEALALADKADEMPARDESPVGLWMERIRALYGDFSARIRAENYSKSKNIPPPSAHTAHTETAWTSAPAQAFSDIRQTSQSVLPEPEDRKAAASQYSSTTMA